MNFLLYFVFLFSLFAGIKTQENAQGKLSNALLECYNNSDVLLKDYKLPQNIHSFIAIIRKIEDDSMLNMDLRQLSVALIHRFRQDGIVFQPLVDAQPGVTPYAPNGFQFYRHAEMLKLIPGNAQTFPNNSITKIERCSLHSMVSSTIDTFQRGDESSTCRVDNESTRILDKRSIDKNSQPPTNQDDVETLSPEQIEIIKNNKDETNQDNDDKFLPNNWYPEVPPNHPENSHLEQTPTSQCPSESGVMKTDWGVVSGGPVLAGIAAALQPQNVKISDLMMRRDWSSRETLRDVTLDNKWIATLAGDLVEVALRQGPMKDTPFKVGTEGHFISSIIPKNYYLNEDQALELTAAEIRGDLDGLIIANEISYWYSKVSSIKLSQILDMYYSDRGVFNTTIRACNRKNLLKFIAQNDTITKQTFRAALVLGNSQLPLGTISDENIEKFSIQVVNKLFDHVSTSMSSDKNCQDNDVNAISMPYNRLAVDLKIFIDTTWPFTLIKPILHLIIEKSDVNKFASNFTLLNAKNGEIMINSSYNILDIYNFNETQYASFARGFDLPKTLDVMKNIQTNKLNRERDLNIGGGKSDIYLIVPYSLTSLSDTDKDYSLEKLIKMREDAPDGKIIFLTGGAKDRWSSLVVNSNDDIFTVGSGTTREIRGPIDDFIIRIKKLQRRLINSQCGANYESVGYTASFTDYIEPSGINFYRLHPNYFFKSGSDDNQATIKIQGQSSSGSLKICHSRETLDINSTGSTCTLVDSNTYSMTFGCSDANYIHECSPLFLSIFYNNTISTNYQCTDSRVCRYPDMIKYTISYENLNCKSTATLSKFSLIFIPIICLVFKIFN